MKCLTVRSVLAILCAAVAMGEEVSKDDLWKLLSDPDSLDDRGEGPRLPKVPDLPEALESFRVGKESWPVANVRYEFGDGWLRKPMEAMSELGRSYVHPGEGLAVAIFQMPLARGGDEVAKEFLNGRPSANAVLRITGEAKVEGRAKELGMTLVEFESNDGGRREVGLAARMVHGGVGYILSVTGRNMAAARREFDRFLGSLAWIDEARDGSVPPVEGLALGWAGVRIPCGGEWLTPQRAEMPNGVAAARMTRRVELTALDVRGMAVPLRELAKALLEGMAVATGGKYELEDTTWGERAAVRARPKPGEKHPGLSVDWVLDATMHEGFLCVAFGTLTEGSQKTLKRHGELLARAEFSTPAGEVPVIPDGPAAAYAALFYNNVGLAAFSIGKIGIASEAFRKSLDLNGADPAVALNLANSLNEQGRTATALAVIERAATDHPEHAGIRLWKAGLLAKAGRSAESADLYEILYRDGLRDEGELGLWIGALQASGRHARAAEVAREMHTETGRITWQRVLANCLWTAGDLAGAREQFQQLAPELAGEGTFASDHAALLVEMELNHEALDLIARWEKNEPASEGMQFNKGIAQMGLGRFKEAVATFSTLSEAVPGNQTVLEWLGQARAMLGQGGREGLRDDLPEITPPAEISARAAEVLADLDVAKEYPGEGWVLLEDTRTWHWRKGEDASCTHRQRIQLLGAAGVSAFSTLYIPLKPTAERVTIHRVEVTPGDGGPPARFRNEEVHVRDSGGGLADGSKLVCIPVPALKEGAVIEFVHTRRLLGTADRHPLVNDPLPEGSPLVYGALVFTGELDAVKFVTTPGLEPVAGDTWRGWESVRQPRRKGQAYLPPFTEWGRICWAGAADRTWRQEAEEYLGEIRGILEDDAFAGQVAADLGLAAMPPREAIRTVVRWMNRKFQYQGLEFGRRARMPAKGADTLARSFGDCKDFSILLRAILRKAGIAAELALTHSGGSVREEIASLDQFDHMVVYLPDHGGLVLDGTARHFNTPEALANSAIGVPIFRLEAAEPGFVLPRESPETHRTSRIERDVEINAEGVATVREVVVMPPVVAAAFRHILASNPAAEHVRLMDQWMRRVESRAEVTRFTANDLEDPFQPLRIELDYTVKAAFEREEGRLLGAIPVVMERWLMQVDQERDRTLGMKVGMAEACESTTRITAPAGAEWLPSEAPREPATGSKAFSASLDWSGSGNTAELKSTLRLMPHAGDAAEFTRLADASGQALDGLGGRVRFKLP